MLKNNTKSSISLILYSFILGLLILLKSFHVVGSTPECEECSDTGDTPYLQIFDGEQVLKITLEFNSEWILNCKTDDEFPAKLIYHSGEGNKETFHIKIRARGNTRRMRSICSMPPLRINFRKSEVKNTIFQGQDKLKLVTHCRNNKVFEGYTLQEYYIYRTYNLLTNESLRVQLVNITYNDLSGNIKPVTRYGFFIENKKEFENRMDGEVLSRKITPQEACDKISMDRFNMFQFMIGNTDWWVTTQHNVILLQKANTNLPIPVPYDFDYAGIINTIYAVPHETIPISNVRQRFYKGRYDLTESFLHTIQLFQNRKNEIIELYENSEHLTKIQKRTALKYYQSFYEILNDPESMQKYFHYEIPT
jgi:hypothetical protein